MDMEKSLNYKKSFYVWCRKLWLNWKYRHYDPDVCCCGCMMGEGGSICHHGGCRSMKEYVITSELKKYDK